MVNVPVPPVDAIKALQLQVCAMSNEIQEKYSNMYSGKEEFWKWVPQMKERYAELSRLQCA